MILKRIRAMHIVFVLVFVLAGYLYAVAENNNTAPGDVNRHITASKEWQQIAALWRDLDRVRSYKDISKDEREQFKIRDEEARKGLERLKVSGVITDDEWRVFDAIIHEKCCFVTFCAVQRPVMDDISVKSREIAGIRKLSKDPFLGAYFKKININRKDYFGGKVLAFYRFVMSNLDETKALSSGIHLVVDAGGAVKTNFNYFADDFMRYDSAAVLRAMEIMSGRLDQQRKDIYIKNIKDYKNIAQAMEKLKNLLGIKDFLKQ